jgi:hypothetical protein
MRWAERWALRAYPPSFRDRYGAELAALTEDVGPSWRHTADLYAGAARAWLRPAFAGPDSARRRMQASVSTVWVAWCAGFMLAPAMTKAIVDPPGPSVDATARWLLDISVAAFAVGWLVALAGAALLGWRSMAPVVRTRQWSDLRPALRPLVPALVLGIVEAGGLVALVLAAGTNASRATTITIASVWLVGLLALLVSGGLGPAVTIRRLQPGSAVLRVPTMLAAALSACLATMAATCTAAVVIVGDAARLAGAFAPVAAVVTVGVVAAASAVVSSARGVLALRGRAASGRA